ncbi:MAG: dihydroorotate dehydrogenase (quinone), partial [Alphaproteobacteria bacterium]|nr:dihydroorotate dehydrogenase (quinone) [Alphaproteobacteria bacterium]
MLLLPFDIYPFLRPLFFCLDPEKAHGLVVACMKYGLMPVGPAVKDDILKTTFCSLNFAHPLGLAAGFDKHAEVIGADFDLGFS